MLAYARPWFACVVALCAGCSVDGIDTTFGGPSSGGGSAGGQSPGGAGQGATGQGGVPVTDDVVSSTVDTTVTSTSDTTVTSGPTTATTTGGPGDATVFCDGDNCLPGQVCCYYQFQAGQDFCAAPDSCPDDDGWVEQSCNGPDDCDGECCGFWSQQVGWGSIQCQEQCGAGQLELCFGDPTACEGGTQECTPSDALGFGYSFCGGG